MKVNKDQVLLFQFLSLTILMKEYVDELKDSNLYVRELKKELNRRKKWERKYIDKHKEDIYKVSSDDIVQVLAGLEGRFLELVEESTEKLLELTENV